MSKTRKKKAFREKSVIIKAPVHFSITSESHREKMLGFINRLTETKENKITLDLRELDFPVISHGMLVFIAALDDLVEKRKQLKLLTPLDLKASELLQHLGIYDLTRTACDLIPKHALIVNWRYNKGFGLNLEHLVGLKQDFLTTLTEATSSIFFGHVSEAISNSVEHGYSDVSNYEMKKWWLFSNKTDDTLIISIYDRGIGIPRSMLQNKTKWELVDERLRMLLLKQHYIKSKAHKFIEKAITTNRSVTAQGHRGKGLFEMLEFARTNNIGSFTVHSEYGTFYYANSAEQERPIEKAVSHNTPLKGTMITWKIPTDILG
jgi:hypothetical protein